MILTQKSTASVVGGMVFGLAAILYIDGMIIAQQEKNPENRFSFTLCIPAIFSVVGFIMFLLVSPSDIKEDGNKAKIVLFVSWMAMFGSTVGALVLVFFKFKGAQGRARAAPGVEMVLFTALAPLAASFVWWSRGVEESEDW